MENLTAGYGRVAPALGSPHDTLSFKMSSPQMPASPALTDILAPGQLVQVRHRPFVVTSVDSGSLPPDAAAPHHPAPCHRVTLTSVDDDGLGEELKVIWELEAGAEIRDAAELPAPDGFDPPNRLDAFLDAVRWAAVASADRRAVQAPFRSGVDFKAMSYQLDPVARALRMPRVNLLIADDVGLGKTIEAGLVVQELLLRHRARTVLVVCPSSLQVQWQDQMRDKFGLEFRIIDSRLLHDLRRTRGLHTNPWNHFPRLITSIDFLKRERPLRLFRELLQVDPGGSALRNFDMLIVDEAHNVAPSGNGLYPVPSRRTAAIRTIAPHFEHKLFLSATPRSAVSRPNCATGRMRRPSRNAASSRLKWTMPRTNARPTAT